MENRLDSLFLINKESNTYVSEILNSYMGKKINPISIEFFTLNILRHLVYIQKEVSPLLVDLDKNPHNELPIGILLRSACMDILQFGYISKCIDEVELISINGHNEQVPDCDKLNDEIKKFFSGNIKNQILDERVLLEEKILDKKTFDESLRDYKERYQWLSTENEAFDDTLSGRKLFKELRKSQKYFMFSSAFIHYSYYSKLEHIGILTWTYTISPLYDSKLVIFRIIEILIYVIHVYKVGFIFLERSENEIKEIDGLLNQLWQIKNTIHN